MSSMLAYHSGKSGFKYHNTGESNTERSISDYDVIHEFNEMKQYDKHRFLILKVQGSQIVLNDVGPPSSSFQDMTAKLVNNECCFVIYMFTIEDKQNPVFIIWVPEAAPIRDKMRHASAMSYARSRLIGVATNISAHTLEDLQEEKVLEQLKATRTCILKEYSVLFICDCP